jgi:hypothetical protein
MCYMMYMFGVNYSERSGLILSGYSKYSSPGSGSLLNPK